MRALTIRQPWADLIIAGVKDVENRTWPVPETLWGEGGEYAVSKGDGIWLSQHFRIGVHAAQAVEAGEWEAWDRLFAATGRQRHAYDRNGRTGALLGFVTVRGCHHADACHQVGHDHYGYGCSPWAEPDVYHWTLTDPEPLDEPIPMRGYQRLWTLDEDAVAEGKHTLSPTADTR